MENIIIIGGGPAGLAAAIYAARAGLKPLVIEGQPSGGQLMLTTEVENYPGFPKGILGPQLIQEFRVQAERFGTRFVAENVTGLKRQKNGQIEVKLNQQALFAQSVLIATGADAKWLNLPSEQRLRGKGVSACATCDGFFFKGKTVAVVGGGDTAMEEANFLTRHAATVYLIHRRDQFRASKIMQARVLKNPKVKAIYNAAVQEVLGQDKVEALRLKLNDGKIQELKTNGLFIAIGHSPATGFLKDSGVLVDKKGYVYTSARIAIESATTGSAKPPGFNYQTNIPGVFAAGDCVDYIYRQAGVAAGMGIAAELEVERYLDESNAHDRPKSD